MIDWIKKATGQNHSGNYKFHVKSDPNIIDTSTTLTLTTFTDKTEKATVPCNYKWFRIRNGLTEEVGKFRGCSYVCQPSDIGSYIQAQITSMDSEYSGRAVLNFGPVKLDLSLKKQIETTLSSGSTIMTGFLCSKDEEKQCQFKIFQDMIKICHCYSEANYTFNYSIYEPRIEIMQKDSSRVQIVFGQRYQFQAKQFLRELFKNYQLNQSMKFSRECKMEIRFANRAQKDMFIFVLKSFYTKRQLKHAVVIQKIQHIDLKENDSFNYLLEIQTLKMDIQKAIQIQHKTEIDKHRYKEEVHRLEKEIEEIILTYTKIVENKFKSTQQLNQSYSILTTKRDEVIGKKYKDLESENNNLNERIRLLTNEIDQIRYNTEVMKNNQTVQNLKESNLQPTDNAFTKKKMVGQGHEETNFLKILDQLEQSQVKQYPEDYQKVKQNLQVIRQEKMHLEKNLEKSFQKIDCLEKQLHQQGSSLHNVTAINFRYHGQQNNQKFNFTSELQLLKKENSQLKKLNDSLVNQNNNLQSEISLSASRIIIKKTQTVANRPTSNNSFEREVQSLKSQKIQLEVSVKDLLMKNEQLRKDIIEIEEKYKRKLSQAQRQLDLYRQNQNVLNRSQYLSMEMQNYNEEQIKILREHNEFLTSENEKLVKACEKYMNEAKQASRLRQENLNLKERLNRRIINPENSSSFVG